MSDLLYIALSANPYSKGHYYVSHPEGLQAAFVDWLGRQGNNKYTNSGEYSVNFINSGDPTELTRPGFFYFQWPSGWNPEKPSAMVFRYDDSLTAEDFKNWWRVPNLPASLAFCEHWGCNTYAVYNQTGVEAAYYHYLIHNTVSSMPLTSVNVESFPALLSFRHEGEHGDMEYSAILMPGELGDKLTSLSKAIIEKARIKQNVDGKTT